VIVEHYLFEFMNEYQCDTNVNIIAWNWAGTVPGPVETITYSRGGFWKSEVWDPDGQVEGRPENGVCVELSWTDSKGRTKSEGGCFKFTYLD
jgi:hypothetical protein